MKNIAEQIKIVEKSNQSPDEKIRLLRCQRCKLLDEIHIMQQLLDKIDYLIIQIRKENMSD